MKGGRRLDEKCDYCAIDCLHFVLVLAFAFMFFSLHSSTCPLSRLFLVSSFLSRVLCLIALSRCVCLWLRVFLTFFPFFYSFSTSTTNSSCSRSSFCSQVTVSWVIILPLSTSFLFHFFLYSPSWIDWLFSSFSLSSSSSSSPAASSSLSHFFSSLPSFFLFGDGYHAEQQWNMSGLTGELELGICLCFCMFIAACILGSLRMHEWMKKEGKKGMQGWRWMDGRT